MTPGEQVLSVVSWLLVISLLQISVYPSLKKTLGRFAFPAAFPASVLFFTLVSWYCGLLQVPVQIALVPFAVLFLYHAYHRQYTAGNLKQEWQWELIFLIFFFLMLDVRFVNPTISYAEKFMDHAFLASVMRTPVVPPLDPWFAGETLDVYYYLGYWMFGCLAIVSGVASTIAFNLALPTVFGMAAVMTYAIGNLLLDRFRWLPLLIFFMPNPSFFYQIAIGKGLNAVLWDSTRTITNTINEYPLFSFIWGDLHPHVMSIFNQVFLIFLLVFVYKKWESLGTRGKWLICILAAVSLGSMPLINTWDVLIYAPITLMVGALVVRRNRTTPPNVGWLFLLSVPVLSILCYVPFYLELKANTGGIALVRTPSDPVQFLLVNGFFIVLFIVLLSGEIRRRPYLLLIVVPFVLGGYSAAGIAAVPLVYFLAKKEKDAPELLAIAGLLLLIIVEFVYLKDNMGDTYFRMNTVFKSYLPAWIILGTSGFLMAGKGFSVPGRVPHLPARTANLIAAAIIIVLFFTPFMIPLDLYSYGGRTLDGLAYLEYQHPSDAGAIAFLRGLSGNETIVEAEDGDYTYYSRVSSFTGIPAIIGQPFHEFMWHGDASGWYNTRINDIAAIYEQPDETVPLMEKYNATLLYVGEPERERYPVDIGTAGLHLVYSANGTDIYRLAG
jgi:YYY domain-containing protein